MKTDGHGDRNGTGNGTGVKKVYSLQNILTWTIKMSPAICDESKDQDSLCHLKINK